MSKPQELSVGDLVYSAIAGGTFHVIGVKVSGDLRMVRLQEHYSRKDTGWALESSFRRFSKKTVAALGL